MTTPLTPGRAIAWAAIFDAHEHRLPHWSEWSADLRAWADAQIPHQNEPVEGRLNLPLTKEQ